MLKNYFIIAARNILRQKFYSLVNILGLAIGIACFILAALWVKDELSYDKHFKNADRIYRIENALVTNGEPTPMSAADPRIAEKIRAGYPEIENIVRINKTPSLLAANDRTYYEQNTYYADSTFFDIFSYIFTSGNSKTALLNPGSIVLSESVAKQLWGNADPMGQTVIINNTKTRSRHPEYKVTGIIKDDTRAAHFHPKVVIAKFHYMETFELTYMLLYNGYDPERFRNRVWKELYGSFFRDDYTKDGQDIPLHRLQPLTQIHLGGNLWEELEPNGNMYSVFVFSAIGLLILLIACINYINLATARSFNRAREVGIRKVLGATRRQIIKQFLVESVILSLIALLLALAFVETILPSFNRLAEKNLVLQIQQPFTVVIALLTAIATGFVSGLYPAFFISSFQPARSVKGMLSIPKKKLTTRKALVIVQFTLSIVVLVATIVIARQLNYLKNYDLGFNKERMLVVNLNDQKANVNKEKIKEALLKNQDISHVTSSFNIPGSEINHTYISFERDTGMEAKLINSMFVDYDYIDAMGLQLLEGKNFDRSMVAQTDTAAFIILNQSAVKLLGYKSCVGKKIETGATYGLRKGYCIGMVKDFHASSLHDTIQPMVLALGTLGRPLGKSNFLLVKTRTEDISSTINYIKDVYNTYSSGYPFEYRSLNNHFNKQYRKEEKQQVLFNWFAGLSIFISCLGMTGLASFATKQRTKEISIRKISGASTADLVLLLSKDFITLVFISIAIATPLAYGIMWYWLERFAYHTTIGWSSFVMAGSATLLLVLSTIGIQAIVASNKDPAKVLRYE